jgi:hypothetical protein
MNEKEKQQLIGKTIKEIIDWGDHIYIKFTDNSVLSITESSGEYTLIIDFYPLG